MTDKLQVICPINNSIYVERRLSNMADIDDVLNKSRRAQAAWANVGLVERQQLLSKGVDAFVARGDDISRETTWQMGLGGVHA